MNSMYAIGEMATQINALKVDIKRLNPSKAMVTHLQS